MTKQKLKIQKAPKAYNLNPEKLKGASQSILPYLFGSNLYYTEDYEYFDVIKPYLTIPEEPKSLEEISQELDEKFEELLVKTKRKFAVSKESAEYHYNQFCKKQDGDFEYAKTQGYFPKVTFISSGTLDYSTLSVSGGYDIGSPSFVVKQGNSHQGYYTIGDGYYRFYMSEKPNMIFRWFVYKLMGFKWVDEKLA
jgi:hypothetical protein